MNKKYTKMSSVRLLKELEKEKKNWKSLPKRNSFSGLAVSGRLEEIQQVLERREIEFEPIYTTINFWG